MRGNWINSVFAHNTGGMNIIIGDNCGKSISDLMYLKEASDGTKAKTKEKDPDTKVSYERYGHCSDSMDYMLCYAYSAEFTLYQKGGVSTKITVGNNPTSKHRAY
jgi:hypothetical protein